MKTVETTFNEQTQTNDVTTKYYLRSTVLGGQVLTEVSELGTKLRTFVYAGDSVLAWQMGQSPWQRVVWEHRDASGASFRTSDASGNSGGLTIEEGPAELDPTGANAETHAPLFEPGPPPDETGGGSLVEYPRFSNPGRPGTTYRVDGIPVSIDYFMMQLDNAFHGSFGLLEAGARASNRIVGFRNRGVSWGRSFERVYDQNGRLVASHMGEFNSELAGVNYGVESAIYDSSWGAFALFLNSPQNPSQPPIDESGVRQNIANRLTKDCKQYIANLINEAARKNRKNPAVSTNLLDIFDAVQKQGGFHRLQVGTHQNPSYSHVLGTIPGKSATVYLAPLKLYPDMTAGEIAQGALGLDSLAAFHELTHLSGSKEYDDIQLSRAARALGGPALPTAKTNKDLAFSTYLEAELKRNCPP